MAISTASAPHYVWGEGCEGWHLVRTADLSVIEERMAPNTSERRHVHSRAQQFFYVLAGELTIEVAGETTLLRVGEGVAVAPGKPHQAFNKSAHDVRFLVTSQPPSHGDRTDA